MSIDDLGQSHTIYPLWSPVSIYRTLPITRPVLIPGQDVMHGRADRRLMRAGDRQANPLGDRRSETDHTAPEQEA
jgi:hypothetical protein